MHLIADEGAVVRHTYLEIDLALGTASVQVDTFTVARGQVMTDLHEFLVGDGGGVDEVDVTTDEIDSFDLPSKLPPPRWSYDSRCYSIAASEEYEQARDALLAEADRIARERGWDTDGVECVSPSPGEGLPRIDIKVEDEGLLDGISAIKYGRARLLEAAEIGTAVRYEGDSIADGDPYDISLDGRWYVGTDDRVGVDLLTGCPDGIAYYEFGRCAGLYDEVDAKLAAADPA